MISLGGILRLLRFESFSTLTFKLLFRIVSLLLTHINNVWAWHWALSLKKERENKKKSLLVEKWDLAIWFCLSFTCLLNISSMNHLFVPFTVFYIWAKQLALILLQFCCSKSKGDPKKKLMKLKAFWFIALSFPRVPRQNVKEIGGFSVAQSLKVWPLDSMHQNQGVREGGHVYLNYRFLNPTADTRSRHLWQLGPRTHISIISRYVQFFLN